MAIAGAQHSAEERGIAGGPETPIAVLRRVFGYAEFRGQQQAIIEHVMAGGDAVVLMPTGGGKSLCYQLPALLRPGVGVVVSPLIALMKDQVDALRQAGVRAAALNSGWRRAKRLWSSERSATAHSTCCTCRRNASRCRIAWSCWGAAGSRCSRSTRRIASRNGDTISAATTRRWAF
jgi:hypothetical protein